MTPGVACPHCGSDAPIVYRGVVPCCTACGGVRAPLSGASVNLAGGPSKVGGALASIAGWVVLLVGLSVALGVGLLLSALVTVGVAIAVALPVAILTLGVGVALVLSGRALRRTGMRTERSTREQALLAMAAHRGAVTAADAARALGVDVADADALLTDLAKRDPDHLTVEVDDRGVVWYRARAQARVRVDGPLRVPDAAEESTAEGEPTDAAGARPARRWE